MKKTHRRDKMKIYNDLLNVLNNQDENEKTVLTKVQVRINVPFDRLKKYISELSALGLIEENAPFRLTEKGKQYLIEYERVFEFMKRMGLSY
jgi:predicted transcriptional regulator